MSTLEIVFNTQALDFGPLERGTVTISYNDGNQDFNLNLNLRVGSAPAGYFQEVAWIDGFSGEDTQQCINYRDAWNRDYSRFGGVLLPNGKISKNLAAALVDDTVVITAQKGTFNEEDCEYTGNVLVVSFNADNSPQVTVPILNGALTGNGDCSTVEYNLTASQGVAPYILKNGATIIDAAWDGSSELVDIGREVGSVTFNITDSNGQYVSKNFIVPRKLKIGEFKQQSTQYVGYTDILIENVNPVANTEPITYALEPQGTLTGTNYQSENTFQGMLPGFYELFVKDKYGCEITKTIQVISYQDATEQENPRYFDIPKGNSIIMTECRSFDKDVKPNYNNTLSFNELSSVRYDVEQYFDASDFEPIQFKSSYPFHVVTLHKSNGTKQDLPPILVQENLGSLEKVDCELFPIGSMMGVYFDGGNEYEPNTSTVIGASEYTQFMPSWAVEGQLVTIEGMGTFEIMELGYDSILQRGYFVVDTLLGSATGGVVQVSYNIQPYNVFEVYVPMNFDKARLVIEKGFSFDEIDGRKWVSEMLVVKENEKSDLLIECSSSKNQSDIVFFSGVKFKKRIKGKFRPIFPNSSEISEGDSRAYSIDQQFYQHYRLELEKLSAREVHQLLVFSKTDGFKVNGESLIMKQEAEIEPLGESNFYTFTCDYAYGGNQSAIQPDSIALNPSTGLPGGGGTGKPGTPPVYDGKLRINVGGGFITVGEEFISIDE